MAANTSNFRTLHTRIVGGNADTVEWCPIAPYQNYFVCGTYSCVAAEDAAARSVRRGAIILYCYNREGLMELYRTDTSAILDLKWCPVLFNETIVLAAATGNGEIRIYHLADGVLKYVTNISLNRFNSQDFLVLSIDWPKLGNNDFICSSDSDGYAAVIKYENETLTKLHQWHAHTSEAWAACFDAFNCNLVYTGGDDNKLQVWDLRGAKPVRMMRTEKHSSGVTALNCHPYMENCLVSGSYDETLLLWDTRNMREPTESMNSNGGLWRLKWKPREDSHHILTASIFAGFEVIDPFAKKCIARHREHDSLAYGADWAHLDERHFFDRGQYLVAVCSFYDQKLSICLYDESIIVFGPGD